jgi:effector-binding domain-containing protein
VSDDRYVVDVQWVESRTLAAAHGQTDHAHLAETIYELLNKVWPAVRAQPVAPGHNVVLYPDMRTFPFPIVAGVEVGGEFVPTEGIERVETPAGEVVTTTHVGPYSELRRGYDALLAWCTVHGRTPRGPSWEVYGDWAEDPAELVTELYFLLGE